MSDQPPEAEKYKNAGQFLSDKEEQCLFGVDTERESQRHYRIRHKTLGALADLFTVGANLNNKNAKKLFKGAGNITTDGTTRNPPDSERDGLPGREPELSAIIALGCRGYKANDIDPEEFVSSVVKNGIEKGIADYKQISPGRVSVDLDASVTVHESDLDALEKWNRNIRLTQEDMQELISRVSNHTDVDDINDKDINELIDEHLVESDE